MIASDVNNLGTEYKMSGDAKPDTNVAEAMAASMAIPVFFSPRQHGHHLLVDGGLVNHFPIAGLSGESSPENTLGVLCEETVGGLAYESKRTSFSYF